MLQNSRPKLGLWESTSDTSLDFKLIQIPANEGSNGTSILEELKDKYEVSKDKSATLHSQ